MAIDEKIKALTKQLFPTGRVWRINPNSIKEKFVNGLLASEIRAYNDAVSILDSALPDNTNFTADDASAWEKRLGLPDGTGIPLDKRIDAIRVQLNWPGTNPAKAAVDYIQSVLQAAGFNVFVYENIPAIPVYQFINPNELGDSQLGDHQLGDFLGGLVTKIANYIDENLDLSFDVGPSLRSTFFIGGSSAGTFANVPSIQKDQFRQLILKIKPVQAIGYLLINYTP